MGCYFETIPSVHSLLENYYQAGTGRQFDSYVLPSSETVSDVKHFFVIFRWASNKSSTLASTMKLPGLLSELMLTRSRIVVNTAGVDETEEY